MSLPTKDTITTLRNLSYNSLLELATDEGINASGKQDVYSCIFGRDSAITILKMLKAISNPETKNIFETTSLLDITKRGLLTLVALQGQETNIESGEQPGKFIHEYRKDNIERLLNLPKPWYVYPDNTIKSYDSLDSTPLTLIALYRYYEMTQDSAFLFTVLPAVERGLNWIITYGDMDKDGLVEYELPKERQHGGLVVQSWTDSNESLLDRDGAFPLYPIAPVEVQGYTWLALKLWADFYQNTDFESVKTATFAKRLSDFAVQMKKQFNRLFLFEDLGLTFAAQILDGEKNQRRIVTGNPLLLLWATYQKGNRKGCVEL